MIERLPILTLAFAIAAALAGPASAVSAEARFVVPSEFPAVSGDGSISLAWERAGAGQPGAPLEYEVRRWPGDAPGADAGVAVYRGSDTASFVSGLPAGEHVFKIRARLPGAEFGEWSDGGARVDVVFPSGGQVLALMAAGAATLAVAVGSIAIGHRRTRAG